MQQVTDTDDYYLDFNLLDLSQVIQSNNEKDVRSNFTNWVCGMYNSLKAGVYRAYVVTFSTFSNLLN